MGMYAGIYLIKYIYIHIPPIPYLRHLRVPEVLIFRCWDFGNLEIRTSQILGHLKLFRNYTTWKRRIVFLETSESGSVTFWKSRTPDSFPSIHKHVS